MKSNSQTINNLKFTFEASAAVPDLDELFANFSNLDPRSETFRLPAEPVGEDWLTETSDNDWFANAPGANIYKIDEDDSTTDDYGLTEEHTESFSDSIVDFPEPEESIQEPENNVVRRRSLLHFAMTVIFFMLCIGMMISAGIFAYSKISENSASNKYTYSMQSPTMTPEQNAPAAKIDIR